ncbi:MAG: NAD(P)/FAD-dependent oxidoreductase [Luminiphilus sp.]|nr:NAD(P)/FAD-dependent oxidoreductase [Luminiphilus sp.]
MSATPDRNRLQAALIGADLRVLLMVMFQISGEECWLQEPYLPRRDVKLIADEDAGFTPELQAEIRAAALQILTDQAGSPAHPVPDEALLLRMMSVCLGEKVAPEYAPTMREQMGFAPVMESLTPLKEVPVSHQLPVIIVGAGISGILLGKMLLEQGIPFRIFDKNSEVGGTWWENRYPGCGVDTPNHAYSFSFGPRYPWRRFFSPRADIQDYLEQTVAAANLYPHIEFNTQIEQAQWDSDNACWQVTVRSSAGESVVQGFAVVSAVGQLNLPSLPTLQGMEDFEGPIFHSSDWPADLDLTGKRVAVLGTGASAMQIVPTLADTVAELTVYQRSPQWARPIPRFHDELSESAHWLVEQVPFYAAWLRFTVLWRYGDGLLPFLRKDPDWPHPERSMNRVNEKHRLELLAHIENTLGDRQDLRQKCIPDYPPYGKRMLLDNGWFQTLLKPNVELVTTAIDHLDHESIVSADDVRREFDVVVLATGFQVGKMAARLNITGRDGIRLEDEWADDDPSAYLGISVAGFPNLFCMMGPGTGLGHGGSAMFQAEVQARYVTECVTGMLNRGDGSMEVKREVQQHFVDRLDAEHAQMVWMHPGLQTYYRNAKGRVFSLLPWRVVDYWHMARHVNRDDYRYERSSSEPW